MAKAKTTSYILYEDTLPQEFDGFKIVILFIIYV